MALIVQKYGGSSVATPTQIRSIAANVARLHKQGDQVIVVVSAMADSTDDLIKLAQQVSDIPNQRELDMLLSTGERVSMALLSMALHDQGVRSISFTGSQAGILTDSSHNNARITELKPIRVEEELKRGKVVVLAGFQGVNPTSKEITTLGRGGSDLTAVAMAAHFKAARCEILKDVEGIFSGDPRVISSAKHWTELSFDALLEMTFWGSQVVHYRAVELASQLQIPLIVRLAHGEGRNTRVHGGAIMLENGKVLSVNSHSDVRLVRVKEETLGKALSRVHQFLRDNSMHWPQILDSQKNGDTWEFFVTGPAETLSALEKKLGAQAPFQMAGDRFASVTATCQGAVNSELPERLATNLEKAGIHPRKMMFSALSVTAIIPPQDRVNATRVLHELVN